VRSAVVGAVVGVGGGRRCQESQQLVLRKCIKIDEWNQQQYCKRDTVAYQRDQETVKAVSLSVSCRFDHLIKHYIFPSYLNSRMVGRDTLTFPPILLLATSRVKIFFALSLARNLIKKQGLKNS